MGETRALAALVAATTGGLVVLVAGVGAVAVFAELAGTWSHYFLMERAIEAAALPTLALFGAALLVGLVAVAHAG